ncbi:hypothetical protein [Arthrobacter pascens]|uniref:hypothetical protein n=1 Tax=Arthrobacter pascens TaxID=1677 RepID=UPI00196B0250|nr:hypothetical protein [Arthrobacter pascens]MBN3500169.1 hypothetical protein [Arthrobacter pascens]
MVEPVETWMSTSSITGGLPLVELVETNRWLSLSKPGLSVLCPELLAPDSLVIRPPDLYCWDGVAMVASGKVLIAGRKLGQVHRTSDQRFFHIAEWYIGSSILERLH